MDLGAPELFVVLIIVLLIFGPGRIARISRELGAGIRQFRRGLYDHSDSVEQEEIGDD